GAFRVHQAQVGLVDQGGGVEGLSRLLVRQLLDGQLAQFVVDQRQELLGGLGVALVDGRQDVGDVAHAAEDNRGGSAWQGREAATVLARRPRPRGRAAAGEHVAWRPHLTGRLVPTPEATRRRTAETNAPSTGSRGGLWSIFSPRDPQDLFRLV